MQFFDYQQHITKILNGLIKGSTRDEPWLVEFLKKGSKYFIRILKRRCKYSTSFEL
jgi:hypothetical protein